MDTTTRILECLAKIVNRSSRVLKTDTEVKTVTVPLALLEEARELMELHREKCDAEISVDVKHASNRVW